MATIRFVIVVVVALISMGALGLMRRTPMTRMSNPNRLLAKSPSDKGAAGDAMKKAQMYLKMKGRNIEDKVRKMVRAEHHHYGGKKDKAEEGEAAEEDAAAEGSAPAE